MKADRFLGRQDLTSRIDRAMVEAGPSHTAAHTALLSGILMVLLDIREMLADQTGRAIEND